MAGRAGRDGVCLRCLAHVVEVEREAIKERKEAKR